MNKNDTCSTIKKKSLVPLRFEHSIPKTRFYDSDRKTTTAVIIGCEKRVTVL